MISGLRYMGNTGTALPYCEEKLEEKLKGKCKAETIPANFLLMECFSPFHFFKKQKVCSAGKQLQGLLEL